MQSMPQTKLIIFDCDGVLVDSEPLAALAYTRVYEKHGMPISLDLITQSVGMKQTDIIARIGELTGHFLSEDASSELWPEIRHLFSERLGPTNGLKDFLGRLSLPRCVASSSSPERIEFSLDVTGLSRFFCRSVFSTSMVRRGKPAPDIFLFAAEKMGVEPANCIVIEDSPLGIEGAVAAGMTAVGYIGGGHTYPEHSSRLSEAGASIVFRGWAEIELHLLRSPG